AQLEEPFVVAGVTGAATNEYRPQSSHRNYAEGTVAREFRRREWIAIHFSDFTEAHKIDILSDEWRKRENLPLVTNAAQKVLISHQFVQSIGSQPAYTSEKELRYLWLANCCFAHISLGFPFLLRFCDEQSGHSVYPFPCYPGPLARSWGRPFHRCGVPYPQAPTLDRDSLTTTIAEFMHIGPHPRRLNGSLGTSNSSAPSAIALKPSTLLALHKALSK